MGTGSGAIAVAAARKTNSVTAIDVNPFAVQCAKKTVHMNAVQQRVRVLQGDLFEPVKDERFDVILFNPPYFLGDAQTWIGRAWLAGPKLELISRFLLDARRQLSESGEIQLLVSSAAPLREILMLVKKAGFRVQVIAKGRILGWLEVVYLLRLF